MDLAKFIVCDANLPWPAKIPVRLKNEAIERHKKAGVTFLSLSLGAVQTLPDTVAYVSRERRRLEGDGRLAIVSSAADVARAKRDNKLAVAFNFQGSTPLGGKVELVDVYRRLGVGQINLAYNHRNEFADGCMEKTDAGLSQLGRSLVKEMNRLGTIVDCSHSSYRASMDAMEVSEDPVIFSHSNADALCPHPRNLKDDQIKRIAERDGFIGVTGVARFLGKPQDNSSATVVEHIDYFAQMIGARYVGYGLDHVFYEEIRHREIADGDSDHTLWAEDERPPFKWVQPEQLGEIASLLARRGYGEGDIAGVMGANYLRVADRIWSKGNRLAPAAQHASEYSMR
jgi:membrane dipeptidase